MTQSLDGELSRALELSEQIMAAAQLGEMIAVSQLDAERRLLLESFRRRVLEVGAADQRRLGVITALNDRAIGALEHHRRVKAREMDMVSVGRRAVAAYASTGGR